MYWYNFINAKNLFKMHNTHFKSQIQSFFLNNIFICLTACQPAIRPGSTMARAPVFLQNKGNRVTFMKLSF